MTGKEWVDFAFKAISFIFVLGAALRGIAAWYFKQESAHGIEQTEQRATNASVAADMKRLEAGQARDHAAIGELREQMSDFKVSAAESAGATKTIAGLLGQLIGLNGGKP